MKEKFRKYSLYICIALILVIVILSSLYLSKEEVISEKIIEVEKCSSDTSYYVEIKGEVVNPGVYKVDNDKRIIDVIELAGGLTEKSDTTLLNLSKKIFDEMYIKIYSKEEVKKALENVNKPTVIEIIKEIEKECICIDNNDACIKDESNDKSSDITDKKLININSATIDELINIPGIGKSKAEKTINYRTLNKFNTIEDIKKVSGIGDAMFDKIKDYITI